MNWSLRARTNYNTPFSGVSSVNSESVDTLQQGVFLNTQQSIQEQNYAFYEVLYINDKSTIGGQLSTGNFAGIKTMVKSMITNMVQNLLNLGKSIMDLVLYFKPEALVLLIKGLVFFL